MTTKQTAWLLLTLLISNIAISQTKQIDSLKNVLSKSPENVVAMGRLVRLYAGSDLKLSKYYAEKAYNIASKNKDTVYMPIAVINLGNVYWLLGELENGKLFFRKAYHLSLARGDNRNAITSLVNLARVYQKQGRSNPAIDTLRLAQSLLEKIKDVPRLHDQMKFNILCFFGECLHYIGKNNEGIKALLDAKLFLNSTPNLQDKALADEGLYMIYQSLEDYKLAVKHAISAMELTRGDPNKMDVVRSIYNVADLYHSLKNYDSAYHFFNQAVSVLEVNKIAEPGFITLLRGKLMLSDNQTDSALYYVRKAKKSYGNIGNDLKLADADRIEGEIYKAKKQPDSALYYYGKAYKAYKFLNLPRKASDILLTMSTLKVEKNDFQGAYDILNAYNDARDTILQNERPTAIADLEVKYKTSIKDAMLSSQSSEIALKTQQRNWLFLIGGVLLFFSLLFAYLYSKVRRQNAIIQSKNREILHNNKNNLQQLISIFGLQAQHPGMEVNALENQQRLQTLSILNNLLYESSETDKANLQTYLRKLAESKQIGSGGKVKVQVSAPSMELKSNIVKDIGLIVNEQMANAMKYAFNDVSNPEIVLDAQPTADGKFIKIRVKDNGSGLPGGFEISNNQHSFGMEFMQDLVEQRHGKMVAYNDRGAVFESVLKIV